VTSCSTLPLRLSVDIVATSPRQETRYQQVPHSARKEDISRCPEALSVCAHLRLGTKAMQRRTPVLHPGVLRRVSLL